MISEVVLASERFATDVAGVGTLVCVRSLVDQQVVRLGEVTSTEPTDVLLLCSVNKQKVSIVLAEMCAFVYT